MNERSIAAIEFYRKALGAKVEMLMRYNPANEAEAERFFAALSEGGRVNQPLTKTFFSPAFGMVVDRFGVSWMVAVAPKT
jgi:uncharacterized glyoxalase superfamily protein PhnB